jgi:hypothetical protein
MTVTNTRVVRRTSAAVGVAATAALLAGCAQELPTPAADDPFTGPVLTVEQETAVVDDVAAVLEKAAADEDPQPLSRRVAGPALEVRTSQIEVAAARDDDSHITQIPTDLAAMIVPTTETWPRASFTITQPTENLEVPRMVAYQQASPRENYKLWSWVQLIPGTTMPNFADPEAIGSEAVAADDDSLVMTPTDALAQYADLVQKGTEESEHTDEFALPEDSPDLVKRVQADARNVRDAEDFDAAEGRYRLTYAPRDELLAVRTSDGGAVVMGVLDGNARLDVEEGGAIPAFTNTQTALLDGADETNELYMEYTDQVALYIPPAGSEEQVRPLGYAHDMVDAANSIPSERNTDREEPEEE